VWRVYPVEGCPCTHWLMGLWSTQTKVEGVVSKAAWHWGSDSSVINNPLGKQGCTPLYVGLLSTWGSMDSVQYTTLYIYSVLPLSLSLVHTKLRDSDVLA
jgi:hypothetical protein